MIIAATAVPAGSAYVLRHAALDLAPLPGAVPCARLHVRHVLREWGLGALADDAEIVVSELVTNAVRHAGQVAGPDGGIRPVRLRLTGRPPGVQVEVWDASDAMPRPRPGDPHDERGGRGLVLVAALAARHGAYRTEGGGKCVYALIEGPAREEGR